MVVAWIYVPIGCLCILMCCWGVDNLIGLSSVSFPASVALLIILFPVLVLSQNVIGEAKTKTIIKIINIPAGFALRYINVFFMPSFAIGFVAMFATTVCMTWVLQFLLGSSKRAIVERAEEMGAENDNIPLTERHPSISNAPGHNVERSDESLALPSPAHDPTPIRGRHGPPESTQIIAALTSPRQDPLPLTTAQRWATYANSHLDTIVYASFFVMVGLPLYYTTTLTFLAHLPISVLSYYLASSAPKNFTRVVHPVILSSAFTIFGIYLLALSRKETLDTSLHAYATKTRYLQIFSGEARYLPLPGAGDVLSSLLDVSIVALALPMYNYRLELRRHFPSIILPNIVLAIASLFGYPALCNALTISPARSLSFASRSLTLALATPATQNLGGDLQLVAVLCIMSGVMGVLLGPTLLSWMKVPESDYITRGVAMGANGSAIATAVLLGRDPRAAALSSLSMTVKKVTALGPQLTPDVSDVSRDGGYSTLINGHSVWLYDDTECMDAKGSQLSFVSNTAAYTTHPVRNITTVTDFGVVNVGQEENGDLKNAILADTTVGTGGWVPFKRDELEFNQQMNGKERVAICQLRVSIYIGRRSFLTMFLGPGTSPTSISTTQAFLYAPLVYVDMKPQDPSKEYQGRGMTLITITAPSSGPVATRQGNLVIPGTEVGFGGFSTLLGRKSTDTAMAHDNEHRDVYLLGVTASGLQLARADVNDLNVFSKYIFWEPRNLNFSGTPPEKGLNDKKHIYMPGTFSSGSVFYSPYFSTFIMIYFNKMVDSTFYIRYLDLSSPLADDATWVPGGKNGKGVEAEDAEALVKYSWSAEQKLYVSPPGKGGFNYAGTPHPEFFNRQYFAKSLYPDRTPTKQRVNDWYGSSLVPEEEAGSDGRYLLISWTSQKVGGMDNNGIYEIQLALVEFDDIPVDPDVGWTPSRTSSTATTPSVRPTTTGNAQDPIHQIKTGSASRGRVDWTSYLFWAPVVLMLISGGFHHPMYVYG
ncbi:MAG: hypothetical protein Q9163_003653 [Psora crenata]